MKVRSCIVLGGGIGGLTIADLLSSHGIEVTVLEKADFFGGLCRSVEVDGARVDLGPHIMRTNDIRVLSYWQGLIGDDLEPKSFDALIYFASSLLKYPVKPMEVMRKLSPKRLFDCGLDLLKEKGKTALRLDKIDSFEDWAISNYGNALYQSFFRPLTEKVWGVPPSTLDVEFGRERLPPLSLRNVLLGIKPKGGFHQEDPAWTTRYYPKHGVYQLCEAILARLRERKVRLVTEAEISEIVEEQDGIRLRLKEVELKADYVVSSIPLPALMAVHRDLAKVDLGRVKYRGIGFVYLSVPADIVLPVATVYCADANMGFNRISDFSLFSRDVCPPGKNILCVEFNLDDEDGSTLKEQGQRILGQLKESGILDLSVIHSVHFETASTVYPIYLKGYREQVLKFFQSSLRQQRLLCFGRQGLFAYNNIDQVILSAFEASEVIVSSPFDRNLKRAYYVGRKRIEHQPDVMLQEDAVE